MSATLVASVELAVTADLDDLTAGELQAHVLELRAVAGRLLGRADQVLAVLHERSGGRVLEHPVGAASEGATGAAAPLGTDPGPAVPMPLLMAVQTWWREATRVAGVQAGRDVRRAQVLSRFPVWGQAVTDGTLTPAQAEVLCRLAGKLPDTELETCQAELVTVAAALNPVELGQWVRHLIATWCEPELDREQDKAEARSWLQLDKRPDGRLAGRFIISSENSEAFLTVLEPLARPQGLTDARTAGHRRADALVDVFTAAGKWLDLPSAGGRPVHVTYVVPSGWARGDVPPSLSALLGGGVIDLHGGQAPDLGAAGTGSNAGRIGVADPCQAGKADEADPVIEGSGRERDRVSWSWGPPLQSPAPREEPLRFITTATDPLTGAGLHPIVAEEHVATAAWSGPQTRTRIEATLCDARISRVLRDGLGQVVSLQSLSGEITIAQRKAVSARDRHCTARGCTRPPAFSDLHHLRHREDGGTTDVDNLVLLCRRHHLMWHRGRLTLNDLHVPWLTRAA